MSIHIIIIIPVKFRFWSFFSWFYFRFIETNSMLQAIWFFFHCFQFFLLLVFLWLKKKKKITELWNWISFFFTQLLLILILDHGYFLPFWPFIIYANWIFFFLFSFSFSYSCVCVWIKFISGIFYLGIFVFSTKTSHSFDDLDLKLYSFQQIFYRNNLVFQKKTVFQHLDRREEKLNHLLQSQFFHFIPYKCSLITIVYAWFRWWWWRRWIVYSK